MKRYANACLCAVKIESINVNGVNGHDHEHRKSHIHIQAQPINFVAYAACGAIDWKFNSIKGLHTATEIKIHAHTQLWTHFVHNQFEMISFINMATSHNNVQQNSTQCATMPCRLCVCLNSYKTAQYSPSDSPLRSASPSFVRVPCHIAQHHNVESNVNLNAERFKNKFSNSANAIQYFVDWTLRSTCTLCLIFVRYHTSKLSIQFHYVHIWVY